MLFGQFLELGIVLVASIEQVISFLLGSQKFLFLLFLLLLLLRNRFE